MRLEQRLSSSSNNNSPPPVLPPKTRKLQQLTAVQTSKTSPNQPDQSPTTPDSLGKQQTGTNSAAAATGAPQSAQVRATSITKRQLGPSDKVDSHLQETFVDDGVSIVRIGQPGSNLNRSASSVTQSRVKHSIAKPVRRSKSQLPGSKFVTNITHGGSVTLVSLNDELQSREFHPIDPDLTPRFVNRGPGLHSGRTVVSAFQGSNTLPRAGQKKKQAGSHTVDDSEIVITKKLTGGGSSVRIRIGGAARSPTEHIDVTKNWREPEFSGACKEGVRNETVIGQDTQTNTNFSHLEKPSLARLSSDSKVGDPAGGSASSTASGIQSNISGKSRQILPRSASVQQTPAKPQSISSSNTKRQGKQYVKCSNGKMLIHPTFLPFVSLRKRKPDQVSSYCFLSLLGRCACQFKLDLVFVRPSKQQRSIFSCAGYEALTRCGRKLIFLLAKTVSNPHIKCRRCGYKQEQEEIHSGPDRS